MNQILVTQKLYITPELKRKKKVYKFNFFLSVFLLFSLISIGIYAEYDRGRSEETSQEILGEFNSGIDDETIAKNNVLIVVLDDEEQNEQIPSGNEEQASSTVTPPASSTPTVKKTAGGFSYTTIANINIPKINVHYGITDGTTHSTEETEALLKESPTKFWGPEPNKVGNFCIVGHNYKNSRFFSKVPTLEKGDIIEITDSSNKTVQYSVYNKYQVVPENLECTSQLTNGRTEITLITCTNDSKERVIVKARAI